jgi:hypothetical protein
MPKKGPKCAATCYPAELGYVLPPFPSPAGHPPPLNTPPKVFKRKLDSVFA